MFSMLVRLALWTYALACGLSYEFNLQRFLYRLGFPREEDLLLIQEDILDLLDHLPQFLRTVL